MSPTRVKLFGDMEAADNVRMQELQRQLAIAQKLRSFQNLPIYRHVVSIEGGGAIDIKMHHNDNDVSITVPHKPPSPEVEKREPPEVVEDVVGYGQDTGGMFIAVDGAGDFLWSCLPTDSSDVPLNPASLFRRHDRDHIVLYT